MVAIYLLKKNRLFWSSFLLVASISAKFSMVLSLPFFFIYLFHNSNLNQIRNRYLIGLTSGAVIFFLPFITSQAGLGMLANNPEVEKIYQLSVSLVPGTAIYLVPLAYLLMLYAAWRVKRINFELFNGILGMSFLLVVLLTPASPGWFIWTLPLLVTYQSASEFSQQNSVVTMLVTRVSTLNSPRGIGIAQFVVGPAATSGGS